MKTIKETPQKEFEEIGFSIRLTKEVEGIGLEIKSNLSQKDIDLLTDILVHTKIENFVGKNRNGSDAVENYMEMLAIVVQMYREKLERTLKILEEYHEDKKN